MQLCQQYHLRQELNQVLARMERLNYNLSHFRHNPKPGFFEGCEMLTGLAKIVKSQLDHYLRADFIQNRQRLEQINSTLNNCFMLMN